MEKNIQTSVVTNNDFLIIALASNPRLYPDIDKLYEENKVDCIKAYHESTFKQSPALKNHTTQNEVYIRKLSGLIALMIKQTGSSDLKPSKETLPLFSLIRKGYKFSWNYVNNKRQLALDIFSREYFKKIGKEVKELDIIHHEICFLFLANAYDKYVHIQGVAHGLLQKYINQTCRIGDSTIHAFSEAQIEKRRTDINELRKILTLSNTKKTVNLDNIIEEIILTESEKIAGFTGSRVNEFRSRVFKEGQLSKYIGALSGYFKSLSLNISELTMLCDLTAEELDEVLYALLYFKEGNNLPEEAEIPFLVTFLYIKALGKEYKNTKHYYIEKASEEQFQDLVRLQNEIDEQKEELQKEVLRVSRFEAELSEKGIRYESELESLRHELKQTKQVLEKEQENHKELIALRQYVHHESKTEEYIALDEDVKKTCLDYLKQKRIVVLGGHIKWQQKLKEQLKHITLVSPDSKNTDLSFLNREGTHLFVNTATNSHSFMERVFAQLNKSDASLHYLHANQNIDKTILTMKQLIENE